MKYWAIVPAAGSGKRMGSDAALPKQYLRLNDRTLLEHSLLRLDGLDILSGIVVVLAENDAQWQDLALDLAKPVITAPGGAERAQSVFNGVMALNELAAEDDWVIVHDAVRPCVRISDIQKLVQEVSATDTGGLLAMPVNDTLKKVSPDSMVETTLNRDHLWRAATPQMFRLGLLRQALENAIAGNISVTDESQAMELAGFNVRLIQCSPDNIKITYPEELAIAATVLSIQQENDRQ